MLHKYGSQSTDVTPEQKAALAKLMASAGGLPDFSREGTDAVKGAFDYSTAPQVGMLGDAYRTLQGNLGATASGAYLDPYKTPGFGTALDTLSNDITNRVKGVYSGSGRSPSGAGNFAGTLGRGLGEGLAPTISNQYNANVANMNAANSQLFGGAGSTASGMTAQQQAQLASRLGGIGGSGMLGQMMLAGPQAGYNASNLAYGQPFQNLQSILGPLLGIAGLGGQQQGTSTTTGSTSPLASILGGLTGGVGLLGSLFSDERLKKGPDGGKPVKVGKLDADHGGHNVYSYSMKGDPTDTVQIGLLGQEVAKRRPSSVGDVGGILTVDYRKATQRGRSGAPLRKAA